MNRKKKKNSTWSKYLFMLCFFVIGAICGIIIVHSLKSIPKTQLDTGKSLYILAALFLGMYVAIFLQIIIHEAGHLIFGLLTGYRYSSFRIGSFMWMKENGKIHLKRYTLAGTGGQCLMIPPNMKNGTFPFILYNLGGSLINLASSLFFLFLYWICRDISFLPALFLMAAVIGFAFALMNGIPMRLGTIDNDGYNAWSLGKNSEALHSFWVQMKTNELVSKGIRIKDMPAEWFRVPSMEGMKNSMTSVMGVFACNWLLDTHEFQKANEQLKELLSADTALVDLYRSMMTCDRIYCESILQYPKEHLRTTVDNMLDKQQKNFMKAMKKSPSILRTKYTYALLVKKDTTEANKIKAQFEKLALTYPYSGDLESERELMEIADNAFHKQDSLL